MKRLGIPNLLSIFRLVLLPVFVICFFTLDVKYRFVCAIIMVVSGLTDIVDGYVARKYHMETQLGRILDPLADKLTLFVVTLTLAIAGYNKLYILAVILFIKELLMLLGGILFAKKYNNNKVEPSKWYGKLATAVLYITLFAMLLIKMDKTTEFILAIIMCLAAIFAFLMYGKVFLKMRRNKNQIK